MFETYPLCDQMHQTVVPAQRKGQFIIPFAPESDIWRDRVGALFLFLSTLLILQAGVILREEVGE